MNKSRFILDFSKGLESRLNFDGAEVLKQFLDRHCFGEVRIQQWLGDTNDIGLVMHVDCPIGLGDLLYHFQMGTWGCPSNPLSRKASFHGLLDVLDYLESVNDFSVDIDEFNIQLKDTLLVLQKTGPRSIAANWNALFQSLSEHYRDFSQGGQRLPEEIYFNVLSEVQVSQPVGQEGLAAFWAMYFEDDVRSWVYDLADRRLSPEELQILPDTTFWDSQPD